MRQLVNVKCVLFGHTEDTFACLRLTVLLFVCVIDNDKKYVYNVPVIIERNPRPFEVKLNLSTGKSNKHSYHWS